MSTLQYIKIKIFFISVVLCCIVATPSFALSSSSIRTDAVKKELGLVMIDMINDGLTPDKDTKKVFKILLSGSKLKESQIDFYKNKFLNKLHIQIIDTASVESEDNDLYRKETTTVIAVLMLLAAEEYHDHGNGYLWMAEQFILSNVGDEVVAECYCMLTAVHFYIGIKSCISDCPRDVFEGYFTSYKDKIERIKTEYKNSLLKYNRAQDQVNFRFDKHHLEIISIMEKAIK